MQGSTLEVSQPSIPKSLAVFHVPRGLPAANRLGSCSHGAKEETQVQRREATSADMAPLSAETQVKLQLCLRPGDLLQPVTEQVVNALILKPCLHASTTPPRIHHAPHAFTTHPPRLASTHPPRHAPTHPPRPHASTMPRLHATPLRIHHTLMHPDEQSTSTTLAGECLLLRGQTR